MQKQEISVARDGGLSSLADNTRQDRIERLESLLQEYEEQLSNLGGTLDHVVNTIDSMLIPTQRAQQAKLDEHEIKTKESHDFIAAWSGAWGLVQKVGIIIAASSGIATMLMNLLHHGAK